MPGGRVPANDVLSADPKALKRLRNAISSTLEPTLMESVLFRAPAFGLARVDKAETATLFHVAIGVGPCLFPLSAAHGVSVSNYL